MDHCILLLQHLSTHQHFIKNSYKRFSNTNSTDPRQRVPLNKNEALFVQLDNVLLIYITICCLIFQVFYYNKKVSFESVVRLCKLLRFDTRRGFCAVHGVKSGCAKGDRKGVRL